MSALTEGRERMTSKACIPYLTVLCIAAVSPALSAQTPLPTKRPQIEHYQDQRQFVIDVLAWEKRQTEKVQADAHHSQTDTPHDWHHVTGPENLNTAIENADGYVQPNYTETYRFNRTTHISFPLPRLMPTEMAEKAATGSARALEEETLIEMERLPEHVIEQVDQLQLFSAQQATPHPAAAISATN